MQNSGRALISHVEVELTTTVAVRAEHMGRGVFESTAQQRNKLIQEGAACTVKAEYPPTLRMARVALDAVADIDVAVRPEGDRMGHIHLASFNELVHESAGSAVEA